MIDALSIRQRRGLALAILLMIVIVIHVLAIVPLWALNRHYLDTIDRLEARLGVLNGKVATSSELRSQHEQLRRALAGNRQYLKNSSDALVTANLQGIVTRVANSKTMELLSTQILATTEEAGIRRVALKVRMRGKLENLVGVFHALETGQPYLFLDNVSIRRLGMHRYKAARGEQLDVDFDLIGYVSRSS